MFPQFVYFVWAFAGLLIGAHRHNRLKTGTHGILSTIIAISIEVGIIWWGGFFDIMHAPQILYLFIHVLGLLLALYSYGTPETGRHHFATYITGVILSVSLLWWGGFFTYIIK